VTARPGAVLLVALVVASCSSPGRLTRQELTEQVNAICTTANEELAGIEPPDPSDPALAADAVARVIAVQREEVDDLDDLRPPEVAEADYDRWLGLLGDVLEQAGQLEQALRDGDPTAADEANATGTQANTEAEGVAAELGFDACTVSAAPAPPETPLATDPGADPSASSSTTTTTTPGSTPP
jgi:hypothetical protein